MKVAYSYERISTRIQADGNGLFRQGTAADRYCQANGLTLDHTLTLKDKVSSFTGKNVTKGNLGAFLKAVEVGTVKAGSVLIVESVDRLSRQEPLEALDLIKQIINAGIAIVTTMDGQLYSRESIRANQSQLFVLLGIMMRAHDESRTKSVRAKAAHDAARAKNDGTKIFGMCPTWIDNAGDTFTLNPTKAATVREIIRLSLAGVGPMGISQKFNKEKMPVLSNRQTGGIWDYATISRLLKSRALLGEFTPKGCQPIKGYYPSVISEADFYKLTATIKTRTKNTKGRTGNNMANLFGKILVSADGGNITVKTPNPNGQRNMVSMNCIRGISPYVSFPYQTFERVFLSWCSEIKLENPVVTTNESAIISTITELQSKAASTEAALASMGADTFDSGIRILANINKQLAVEVAKLETEKARKHAPTYSTSSVAELAIKMETIQGNELTELRATLKAAIAGIVQGIIVTITAASKTDRKANAIITFRDGSVRKLKVKSTGFGISENYDTITIGTAEKNKIGSSFVVSSGGIIPRQRRGLHGKVAA